MELVAGYAAVAIGLTFIAVRWFQVGLGDIPLWFTISSLLMVNTGHLINAAESQGGTGGWAYTGLLVSSAGIVSFMFGSVLVAAIQRSGTTVTSIEWFRDSDVPEATANKRLTLFAILTLGPAWSYFVLLGYVPLFDGVGAVVSDGVDGLGVLQASRLSRDGYASAEGVIIPGQGILQLMRTVGVPALAGYAAAHIISYGLTFYRGTLLGLASVTVLLAGQRWPLLYLGVAVLAGLALSGMRISVKRISLISTLIVAVGVGMSLLQRRTVESFDSWSTAVVFAAQNLMNRIIFEQSYVPILSYKTNSFPPGSLLGASYWESFSAYAPGPGTSFPVRFYMNVTGDSRAYTAAPDFYTEAYINFGIVGVVLISGIWGAILQAVTRKRFTGDKTLNAGIASGLVAVLAQSAFSGVAFTLGGIIIFSLLLFVVRALIPVRPTRLGLGARARDPRPQLLRPSKDIR